MKTRTDLILADERSAEVYAAHFETQMHRGKARRWLYAGYRHLARGGAMASGLDLRDAR